MSGLAITPETKIGELLEAYPEVEAKLIDWVPAFSRLRNPVLRRTVAKVATLEQAAAIGGIAARDLVLRLRAATGQPDTSLPVLNNTRPAADPTAAPPLWLRDAPVRENLDADTMLSTGEHPIGRIRQFAATAAPGDIVRLTSSFRPSPLLDMLEKGGAAVYSSETAPGRHVTFICPKPPGSMGE